MWVAEHPEESREEREQVGAPPACRGLIFRPEDLSSGRAGIAQAYRTGRGSVLMRARTSVEEPKKKGGKESIIVTEMPYQVNKARLLGEDGRARPGEGDRRELRICGTSQTAMRHADRDRAPSRRGARGRAQ